MIKDNSFDQKIIDRIEKQNIKPDPQWKFLLREYTIWILAAFSLAIGGIATAVIIHLMNSGDWDAVRYLNGSFFGFLLLAMPSVWIIFLALFILVAIYNLKHTKKGYKYNPIYIVLSSIVLSILLGALMFNAGIGEALDDAFAERLPFYGRFVGGRFRTWQHPGSGFLGGAIISLDSAENFRIKDFRGITWEVDAAGADQIGPGLDIDMRIRMIGQIVENKKFKAKRILPMPEHMLWKGGGPGGCRLPGMCPALPPPR